MYRCTLHVASYCCPVGLTSRCCCVFNIDSRRTAVPTKKALSFSLILFSLLSIISVCSPLPILLFLALSTRQKKNVTWTINLICYLVCLCFSKRSKKSCHGVNLILNFIKCAICDSRQYLFWPIVTLFCIKEFPQEMNEFKNPIINTGCTFMAWFFPPLSVLYKWQLSRVRTDMSENSGALSNTMASHLLISRGHWTSVWTPWPQTDQSRFFSWHLSLRPALFFKPHLALVTFKWAWLALALCWLVVLVEWPSLLLVSELEVRTLCPLHYPHWTYILDTKEIHSCL